MDEDAKIMEAIVEKHPKEIMDALVSLELLEHTKDGYHSTMSGVKKYLDMLMDNYNESNFEKLYNTQDKEAIAEIATKNMLQLILRERPTPILPKKWFPKDQDYFECAIFLQILGHMYRTKEYLDFFMEQRYFDDLSAKVDWVERNEEVSKSKAFNVVAHEIGKSRSFVRDHYEF